MDLSVTSDLTEVFMFIKADWRPMFENEKRILVSKVGYCQIRNTGQLRKIKGWISKNYIKFHIIAIQKAEYIPLDGVNTLDTKNLYVFINEVYMKAAFLNQRNVTCPQWCKFQADASSTGEQIQNLNVIKIQSIDQYIE